VSCSFGSRTITSSMKEARPAGAPSKQPRTGWTSLEHDHGRTKRINLHCLHPTSSPSETPKRFVPTASTMLVFRDSSFGSSTSTTTQRTRLNRTSVAVEENQKAEIISKTAASFSSSTLAYSCCHKMPLYYSVSCLSCGFRLLWLLQR